jgi:hypothetical protein
VSSANCDNLCSILFTFIPPIFLLPRILMAKISAHKIKRYESIINWVKVFYNNISSAVIQGGNLS